MSHSIPSIVGVHYKVEEKLGEGSFGVIYKGIDLLVHEPVAIKLESRATNVPMLKSEYLVYRDLEGTEGVPRTHYFGLEGPYSIIVMDLLGPSLEDLFEMCGRKFSIKTVAMVGIYMLGLLQRVHDRSYIFRDVKPDNFLIGGHHHEDQMYLIDFGMAKMYRNPATEIHVPYREYKSLSGTARYMSINTHLGREQSRRDDLEALGYVLLYFLRGMLPWQGIKAATNEKKYEKIAEKKKTIPLSELCLGYPDEFGAFVQYARDLSFAEDPNYEYCRGLFVKALEKSGEPDDGVYDWDLINNGKGWQASERKKPRVPLMLMDK